MGLSACFSFSSTQMVNDTDMFMRNVLHLKWNSHVFLQQSFWRNTSCIWVQATQFWDMQRKVECSEVTITVQIQPRVCDPLCLGQVIGHTSWYVPRHPEIPPNVTFCRDSMLKNLCLVGHCKHGDMMGQRKISLSISRQLQDYCVKKNLLCIHVTSCEWERRPLLQSFPVLTSPTRLGGKWQYDRLVVSLLVLPSFWDLRKNKVVSLFVHDFVAQPRLEDGKKHLLGEKWRSNWNRTLKSLAPLPQEVP